MSWWSWNVTALKALHSAYPPGQLQTPLSDDKLPSYLSSLQNSLQLPTLIPTPAWHESFLRRPLWPSLARAAYALNPARRVNLPDLIKIASFAALSLSPSSCTWWHNGAGKFLLQSWLKKTNPLKKNGGVLDYFMMSKQEVSPISFYLLIILLWPGFLSGKIIMKVMGEVIRRSLHKTFKRNWNKNQWAKNFHHGLIVCGVTNNNLAVFQGQAFLGEVTICEAKSMKLIRAVFLHYCSGTVWCHWSADL